jgi:Cu/Ag efflux protein CusF
LQKTMNTFRFVTLALVVAMACGALAAPHTAAKKAPYHTPVKSTPKTFKNLRGQVIALMPPQKSGDPFAVTINHEKIPNFMGAMSMTIPLRNAADGRKLKKGTKISFDLVLGTGNFAAANIRVLPSSTKLKLAQR